MKSLYVSQQGCNISLSKETLIVRYREDIVNRVKIPLLEQILIFGKSQITTQAIRACIWQNIPIVYLSRMGYCYGRVLPLERGYRQLSRYQQQLSRGEKLAVAREITLAKLKNSRVLLQRQQRKQQTPILAQTLLNLNYLLTKVEQVQDMEQLIGLEGAGAASYFSAYGEVITNLDFVFVARSRRPPGNPVNAMLSFGYQILWNHLLALIELQQLDPYQACLHQGNYRHAALASDLIEEFRAPIVDSLVLYLINRRMINSETDFVYRNGGCFLNDAGRKNYLQAFLQRMEEEIKTDLGNQPRWDLLLQQVKLYKQFVYQPAQLYQPYLIR
ncbi:MAG: CRISPR-associated endonuclease Cas1 [Pleurocapsa minor HA4230-MV1]|jgi:CRISPR-associated protein Cas1|nr:CRISPR-associated endonuclease Cas1 [Pleurocapsa minor HA4230-MV1]